MFPTVGVHTTEFKHQRIYIKCTQLHYVKRRIVWKFTTDFVTYLQAFCQTCYKWLSESCNEYDRKYKEYVIELTHKLNHFCQCKCL